MQNLKFSKRKVLIGVAVLLFIGVQWIGIKMLGNLRCEKLFPAEEIQFATSFIQLLKDGKFEEASPLLDNAIKNQVLASSNRIQELFKETDGLQQQIVGCNFNSKSRGGSQQKNINLTFQWASDTKALLGNVAWAERSGKRIVIGLNINPLPKNLQELNAFNLYEKGPKHWIFLVLAMAIPLFMIATFVVCLRTKSQRRKWLWAAFILVGFWQHTLNWTTGEITGLFVGTSMQFISIQLLGVGFGKVNEFSPLLITICVPLGAIIFWIRRKSITSQG